MHTSHKHEEKSGNHKGAPQDDFLEGSSARTRPISVADIILKRKNRGRAASPRDSDIELAGDSVKKALHSLKSDKLLNEDSLPINSWHTVNDSQKVSSRRKKDGNASLKNEKLVQDKYKRSQDHEAKSKVMVDKNKSSTRVVTGKNEGHYHSNRHKDSVSGRDFGNESDIWRTKDLVKNERVSEKPRVKSEINREQLDNRDGHLYRRKIDEQMRSIPENESLKRNTRDAIMRSFPEKESQNRNSKDAIQTVKLSDNGKYKSENENWRQRHNVVVKTRIGSTIKKHDSENRELGFKQDYIEESKSKRRRSRSTDREHDKDRGRRSPLHSPNVHTQTFKDKREHGELSSHSVKDRAGREYSDADKKRRRSRSAEHVLDKERVKRFLLHSSKVHKHISRDKREHGELSLHYIKEKAGRDHSDAVMRRGSRSTERELNKERGIKFSLHSPKVQKHPPNDKREQGEPFSHSIKDRAGRDHSDAVTRRRSLSTEQELNKEKERKSSLHSPKVQNHMPKDKREHRELSSHSIKDRAGRDHSDAVNRRRSRSTEHELGKEREGRSLLHSPKVHQHTSKDKKENGELFSQFINDRAGREHSDADKKRLSGNGSITHYRRNTVSSSGLGGYSPRKRKSDTAAKTPPPTCRSPERKTAGWDLPPVGNESIGSGSTLSNLHASSQNVTSTIKGFPSGTPMTTTMMKPVGISHATLSSRMHAIESIQLTQATRPMRRLYVENLPASASEEDLMGCINKFLLLSGVNYIQGTQPCISCIISKEKGQALLEFLTPEDASAALSFDGILFSGSNLKIRRPKDYADVNTALPDKPIVAVNSVSGIVEDSPYKIFIGGISNTISSKMLLEIVRAFGPVKAYHFEFIADSNEQCAFLEYIDHSVSSKACAALNGMKLGGQVLTTVFATPDAVLVENMEKTTFYRIPGYAKPLLEKPTTVLKLKNVVDPEGLLAMSESELDEVLEDIRLECSRFGKVNSVNVAKPTNSIDINSIHENNTNMSTDGDNLELDNKSFITEQLGESLIEMGDRDKSEPSENPIESQHNSQIAENSKGCDKCASVEPEDSLSQENRVGLNEELVIQDIMPVNELETNDATSNSIPVGNVEMENKPLIVKFEENNSEIVSCSELDGNEVKELDVHEEGDKKDLLTDAEDVFEVGSVLVEYKRAEATCIAAHCLNGRVFDGRIVRVEYVDHDLYQMTFHR